MLIKIPGSAWHFDPFMGKWCYRYAHHKYGPKGKPAPALYFMGPGYWFGKPNRKVRKQLRFFKDQAA